VAVAVSAASAGALQAAAGGVLGEAGPELDLVVGAVVFYMVATLPRRLLGAAALSQSAEAASLAVVASATFEATRSRPRTMLMLKAADAGISRALEDAKREILLGWGVERVAERSAAALASYSAANVLKSTARMSLEPVEEGGEENRAMVGALQLAEESKLPLFMTVCFFTPIMLLLYAVFSHLGDPRSLAELVVVEFVVIDVAFYFSSTERRRLG
jgi:hypothetical protein